jgi:peptidoglycan hydrolase-like protein with peptidoglycan-binding domain
MATYEHQSDQFGYIDLDNLKGAQTALKALGFDPGDTDGLDGPRTQKAVRAFQGNANIRVDGIVGPETRQALCDALGNAVNAQTGTSEGASNS